MKEGSHEINDNGTMIEKQKEESQQEKSFFAKADDPLYVSLLYGAISGTTVVAVGHPLDSIKVRLQTGTTKNIFRNLYKGVLPPFLAVVPSWIAVFLSYGVALKTLGSNDITSVALAGGFSGLFYTMAVCPFEFVKVNAQKNHISTVNAYKNLTSKVGIRGLYRGISVCLCRDVSQSAAYYVCAESLNRSVFMNNFFKNEETRPFFSGAITGVCHCLVEYPFDTIKTRMQTNLSFKTYSECLREFLNNSKELHTAKQAIFPMLTRAVFAHGCSFFVIKQFNKLMDW
jgi:solute carrier family 25 (mitochondrial carnitine/acylcarnitine transporter), member 20/29